MTSKLRISVDISKDLESMIDRLRGSRETTDDVLRSALNIYSRALGNPRLGSSESLSQTFEGLILREERENLSNRLLLVRPENANKPSTDQKVRAVLPRRVFISYAREDAHVAKRVFHKLKRRGHVPWIDAYSLQKGADWRFEIKKAIGECAFFVAVISKNSVRKTGFVQVEVHVAAQEQRRRPTGVIYFIPLKVDDCAMPSFASEFNYVDLRKDRFPYRSLFQTIEAVL